MIKNEEKHIFRSTAVTHSSNSAVLFLCHNLSVVDIYCIRNLRRS
jgi:hypothetical protein